MYDVVADTTTTIRPIRVFVSCTDELAGEREIVKSVIDELNASPYFEQNYKLIAYIYTDGIPTPLNAAANIEHNAYLLRPDSADVFISLLWLRLGKPTRVQLNPETGKPYQSFTEYEFMTAYRSWFELELPRMFLYRCTRSVPDLKKLNLEQYGRVQRFFERCETEEALKSCIYDFNNSADFKIMLRRDLEELLRNYPVHKSQVASQTAVYCIPDVLPPGYVERAEALDVVRMALLGSSESVGLVPSLSTAQYADGQGKTVIARAICDDPVIRRAFPDGVLWATLGPNADPVQHQREWIAALGGDVSVTNTLDGGKTELRALLEDRAMLLVMDDLQFASDALPLLAGGPRCRTLFTGRGDELLPGATLVALDMMAVPESRNLLMQTAGRKLTNVALAYEIIGKVGRSPFTLRVIGSMLAAGLKWEEIDELITQNMAQFADHSQQDTLATVAASIQVLTVDLRVRYHELIIFPAHEPIDQHAAARLWAATGKLTEPQSYQLLERLRSRALLQPDYRLHVLHREYLNKVVSKRESERLHGVLVDSYNLGENDLPPAHDDYGWRRLTYHMQQSGRVPAIKALLNNQMYLRTKIEKLGTIQLLNDFAKAPEDDDQLKKLAGALRLSAHIVSRKPAELGNQLYGRLRPAPALQNEVRPTGIHFRLLSQTLTPPGWPLLHTLQKHTFWVTACAFSPDSRLALSASADHTLRLWDVNTGQSIRVLRGHAHWVTACVFSADGQRILSASADKTLQLWDTSTGKMLRTFRGHSEKVNSCSLSADGRFALSASDDHTVKLWDVNRAQIIHTLEGHTAEVTACTLSQEGHIALSASNDMSLIVWDTETGQPLQTLKGHKDAVTGCALSTDGSLALSASGDGSLQLWDVESGTPLLTLEGHTHWILGCSLSGDGRLALSASVDNTLRLWDVHNSSTVRILHADGALTGCALSADGRLALSSSADKTLQLWDLTGWQPKSNDKYINSVGNCKFSADGKLALSVSGDNALRLWETDTRLTLHIFQGHKGQITACNFSSDGKLILSASEDRTIRVWDIATGQLTHTLRGHTDSVGDAVFSPNNQFVLSASADATLRLWDVAQGVEVTSWLSDVPLYSCAFNPDGQTVITSDQDGTLHFLSLENVQAVSE